MKRLFALSLAVMLFASIAKAQNSSYVDDRYYSGSEAEQDANTTAKQNKNQQNGTAVQQYDASSGYYDDGNNGNVSDDGYIDYDDDSYTTRINRFYYPMGMSYWGSVYSPYYNDPFWYNPYYSWGGFYPGLSMSFGFGGPYWSSCWAYNAWYGYGGFYPYYAWGGYPYNYGGGYGLGYWNGYYDGFYANNYYHNNYYGLGNTVYGARGNRSMVGNYTRSRLAQVNNSNRMVTPFSARESGNALSINNGNVRGRNASGQPVRGQSFQDNSNERIVLKGNAQRVQNNGTVNNSNQRYSGRSHRQQAITRTDAAMVSWAVCFPATEILTPLTIQAVAMMYSVHSPPVLMNVPSPPGAIPSQAAAAHLSRAADRLHPLVAAGPQVVVAAVLLAEDDSKIFKINFQNCTPGYAECAVFYYYHLY